MVCAVLVFSHDKDFVINLDIQYLRAMVDSYPKLLRVVIEAREERFKNC
ncbi:hypothetical protein CAEBREN_08818 [Caenorhabditis brenneri]|uniref:Uncharacterized protein n=1 Tax=Caenorhabditis brenneri TaxID=135651 RepID=G0N3M7_CAEBE|nr:hypothetical protein CAEBREN_08818 [Caenorhabditis brenneri]